MLKSHFAAGEIITGKADPLLDHIRFYLSENTLHCFYRLAAFHAYHG